MGGAARFLTAQAGERLRAVWVVVEGMLSKRLARAWLDVTLAKAKQKTGSAL